MIIVLIVGNVSNPVPHSSRIFVCEMVLDFLFIRLFGAFDTSSQVGSSSTVPCLVTRSVDAVAFFE